MNSWIRVKEKALLIKNDFKIDRYGLINSTLESMDKMYRFSKKKVMGKILL